MSHKMLRQFIVKVSVLGYFSYYCNFHYITHTFNHNINLFRNMADKRKSDCELDNMELKIKNYISIISKSTFEVVIRSFDSEFKNKCLSLLKVSYTIILTIGVYTYIIYTYAHLYIYIYIYTYIFSKNEIICNRII